jgi:hypothetical protein
MALEQKTIVLDKLESGESVATVRYFHIFYHNYWNCEVAIRVFIEPSMSEFRGY